MFTRLFILILLVTVAACAPTPVQDPPATQDIRENTEEPATEVPATPSPVAENGLEKKFTQIVLNDLATRLNVDVETIKVVAVEPIEWPNAALGCPSPGKIYAQGTVPGFRIRLEVDNQEYAYHLDRTGQFVLCPTENLDLPELPPSP